LNRPAPAAADGLRVAVAAENLVGESPVWSVREQALYWVDVEGRRVQRYAPESRLSARWEMPEVTSSIGLRCEAGLVAATRVGFVFIDTSTSAVTPITHPESDLPGNRFNDGKVDRAGRFFAGTKNLANNAQPTGSLYRLGTDRRAHAVAHGISCTNGIAWSPDNRTMYVCDTWLRRIYQFDFDFPSGTAENRRVFAELADDEGFPDGLTIDADGFLWNAHYDGWRITRYAPDGRIERVVRMPVQHVTSLIFGGRDLSTLFVTSARMRLPEEALTQQPLAGHVLAFEPGVSGLPEPCFAG
jgi:sugar lactone lactonase YvrE